MCRTRLPLPVYFKICHFQLSRAFTYPNYLRKRMTLVSQLPRSCMKTKQCCTVKEQHCQAEQRLTRREHNPPQYGICFRLQNVSLVASMLQCFLANAREEAFGASTGLVAWSYFPFAWHTGFEIEAFSWKDKCGLNNAEGFKVIKTGIDKNAPSVDRLVAPLYLP